MDSALFISRSSLVCLFNTETPCTICTVLVSYLCAGSKTISVSDGFCSVSNTHRFYTHHPKEVCVTMYSSVAVSVCAAQGGSCGLTYVPGHGIPFARALDYGKSNHHA